MNPDQIEYWQQSSYSYFSFFLLFFGMISSLYGAWLFIQVNLGYMAVTNLTILGIAGVFLLNRAIPFSIRKTGILIITYFIGLYLTVFAGPNGLAPLFILLSFFLLALFVPKSMLPFCLILNALIFTVISVLFKAGVLDSLPMTQYKQAWWLNYGSSVVGGTMLTYMLNNLIEGLHSHYQRASEGEAHLQGTLGAIPSGVMVTDPEGNIQLMNPVARRLCKVTPGEEFNQPLTNILQVLKRGERDYLDLEDLLKKGSNRQEQPLVMIPKKGMSIRVRVSLSPIKLGEQLLGYVAVIQDVTQEYIHSKRQSQMDKLEALGKMAGGISHDFNNMLTGILGYSELIKRQVESPELLRYTDGIIQSSIRASELTQSLLNFARISPKKTEIQPLDEIIAQSVHLVQHSNRNKNVEIKLEKIPENCIVKGDFSRLQNSLVNLLMNSCDAMPDGGIIRIHCRKEWISPQYCSDSIYDIDPGPFWKISVEDEGTGIPPSILERILDPFFTTKSLGKGTGLGLSSVYSTIVDHQGAMEITSEQDKGSTFTLFLPADQETIESI